jgi:hypothetical protein
MEPEAPVIVALNEFNEPDLGGWWIGMIIGFVVVVVVVVIVGALLTLASRINRQAREAVRLLEVTKSSTDSLSGLHRTNKMLRTVLAGAATARGALGG